MRSVLYTPDMEPITVIELKPWALDYLRTNRRVVLSVTPPLSLQKMVNLSDEELSKCVFHTVTIYPERFVFYGKETMLLFTRDEESALLLSSAFLPGQWKEVQAYERDAFARGFMDALNHLGR